MFFRNRPEYQKFYKPKFQNSTLKKNIKKHLFLVCAPKSGSTWLSQILENLLEWKSIRLLPSCEHREQEIDINPLLAQGAEGNIISPHQHTRYSLYTEKMTRVLDSRIILQTRNIYDTIISYRDHMENESVIVPAAFMNTEMWKQLSDEEKLSFLVDMVVPWYFNFYCGWITSPLFKEGKVLLVTYEDLKNNPEKIVNAVAKFTQENKTEGDIRTAIEKTKSQKVRKNKGISGRGAILSEELKTRIVSYTKYYPGIDFTPLGIVKHNEKTA